MVSYIQHIIYRLTGYHPAHGWVQVISYVTIACLCAWLFSTYLTPIA
jgi:hypothetical protein